MRARLLLSIVPLLAALQSVPTVENSSVKATTDIISTKYCYGDALAFSVWFRLRVRYTNRTDKPLILDKEIGKAWYGVMVSQNLADLAAGKYEYNPNIDWVFPENHRFPNRPKTDAPGPDFAVLAPDQTFENIISTAVIAQYESSQSLSGIGPGRHVLQMKLAAWNHPGDASNFAGSWRKFGEVVSGLIKTEPLDIEIPLHPNVKKNCHSSP